jgi:hypothetical protein
MVETAAHLTDHVFPKLPVRQWVLSVPKRLRYFMQRDGAVLNMALRIFPRVIAQSLHFEVKEMLAYQHSEPGADKRSAKVDELHLTPLELIDRIAALVPPPRTHRHRYFGVLAPNSPLRTAVTAMAAQVQAISAQPAQTGTVVGLPAVAPLGNAVLPTPEPAPTKRAAHYLWAVLIARIYEVFPLLCPLCGGQMRIIAFITHSADIRHILEHIGVDSEAPRIAPARGPPLWEDCDAQASESVQIEPDWDLAAQPAPDFDIDQRITW